MLPALRPAPQSRQRSEQPFLGLVVGSKLPRKQRSGVHVSVKGQHATAVHTGPANLPSGHFHSSVSVEREEVGVQRACRTNAPTGPPCPPAHLLQRLALRVPPSISGPPAQDGLGRLQWGHPVRSDDSAFLRVCVPSCCSSTPGVSPVPADVTLSHLPHIHVLMLGEDRACHSEGIGRDGGVVADGGCHSLHRACECVCACTRVSVASQARVAPATAACTTTGQTWRSARLISSPTRVTCGSVQ